MSYVTPLLRFLRALTKPEPLQFCDETLGRWPEFVVAQYATWGCDPGDPLAQVPGDWKVRADCLRGHEERRDAI